MTIFLKSAVVALALSSAAVTSGCEMHRDADSDRMDRDHPATVVSVGFGDITFGYSDGYWDNGHHWHQWANDDERNNYRNYTGNHYYDWKHDRDGDDGWHDH